MTMIRTETFMTPTSEHRLERLERSARHWRAVALALTAAVAGLLLMGQTAPRTADEGTYHLIPNGESSVWIYDSRTGESRLYSNIGQGLNPRIRARVEWDERDISRD
ncbi:hypothetical protein JXA47_15275 [Candidatus Sumerlaeota bacterium]|nr:hypothetical protein [Candidatus Sumerlaeota bacterium]